jgi:hypothetical protein
MITTPTIGLRISGEQKKKDRDIVRSQAFDVETDPPTKSKQPK